MSQKPKGEKVIKDFDGNNAPENFDIPSIGIEDIDRAVFTLFDKKISFEVKHKGSLQKVPVIFASHLIFDENLSHFKYLHTYSTANFSRSGMDLFSISIA